MTIKKPSVTAVAIPKSAGAWQRTKPAPAQASRAGRVEVQPAAAVAARISAQVQAVDDESTKATTLRLDPVARAGLEMLRRATGATLNKLVNDAVLMYVSTRSAQLDAMLRDSLQRIAQYRRSDPYFEKSIDGIVQAEAAHTKDDPAEGRMVANHGRGDARDNEPRARRRRR